MISYPIIIIVLFSIVFILIIIFVFLKLSRHPIRCFPVRVFYYTKYVDLSVSATSKSTALNAARRVIKRGISRSDIINQVGVFTVNKELINQSEEVT